MKNEKKGYIFALLSYVMWGALPLFWRLLHDLPSLYIFCSRVLYSFILTILLLVVFKKKDELIAICKQPKKVLLAVIAGIFIASNWLTFIMAVNSDNTIDAALGYFINPLAVVLIGTIFFKEKLSSLAKISVALACTGVILSTVLFHEFPLTSLILTITFTIYGAVKKVNGIDSYISLFIETLTILPFAIYFLYSYNLQGVNVYATGDIQMIALVILTGVVTLTPLIFYSKAVTLIPFNTIGFFQYINPTIMLSIGIFVYHEEITKGQLVSFSFIWIALIVYIYSLLKKAPLE